MAFCIRKKNVFHNYGNNFMDLIINEIFFCAFLEITKQKLFQINVSFLCKENVFFILAYICFFIIMFLNRDISNRKNNYFFAATLVFPAFFAIMASQIESFKTAMVFMGVLIGCGVIILSNILSLSYKIEMQQKKINLLNELNQNYIVEQHNYAQIKRLLVDVSEKNSSELNLNRYVSNQNIEDLIQFYSIVFADMGVHFDYFLEKVHLKKSQKLFFVISNLLENAKEACLENPSSSEVFFSLYSKNNLLVIVVRNSIKQSVLNNNPLLISGKEEKNHGIGLKYIKKIIDENDGVISISEKNGMFQVKLAINIW